MGARLGHDEAMGRLFGGRGCVAPEVRMARRLGPSNGQRPALERVLAVWRMNAGTVDALRSRTRPARLPEATDAEMGRLLNRPGLLHQLNGPLDGLYAVLDDRQRRRLDRSVGRALRRRRW